MITFKYEPIYVKVGDSYGIDRELYCKMFEAHADWLKNNDIKYKVFGFRWPEFLSLMMSQSIVVEFELSIDDDDQAVLFRLFSGMANDT